MHNPTTMDRRDVADPTNPIGGQGYVEESHAATSEIVPADAVTGRVRLEGRRPAVTGSVRSAH